MTEAEETLIRILKVELGATEVLRSGVAATTGLSQDTDASRAGSETGPRLPVYLSRRLCTRPGHRASRLHDFWGEDGSVVCGICHPPNPETARWLRHGGPIGAVPHLGPIEASAVPEPQNDESPASPRLKGRGRRGPSVGQGSLLG